MGLDLTSQQHDHGSGRLLKGPVCLFVLMVMEGFRLLHPDNLNLGSNHTHAIYKKRICSECRMCKNTVIVWL